MQTVSSARRTCIASASAVEWTATVRMPISWQARWMRSAISPRLAISSFSIAILEHPLQLLLGRGTAEGGGGILQRGKAAPPASLVILPTKSWGGCVYQEQHQQITTNG